MCPNGVQKSCRNRAEIVQKSCRNRAEIVWKMVRKWCRNCVGIVLELRVNSTHFRGS
jgi:hypothetical protein